MSARAKLLRTSTFRLAALYLIVFALSVSALLGYVYWNTTVLLERQTDDSMQRFETAVRRCPEVRECYLMSGENDFVQKCVAHDLSEWQSFVTERLTAARHVGSVKTALTIRESKREPGVPVDFQPGHSSEG